MFFRAKDGQTYPLASIERIQTFYRESGQPEQNHFDEILVELKNGGSIIAHRGELDRTTVSPISSFPAAANTYCVSYFEGEIELKPVIGWVVFQDSAVKPVLIHGVFDSDSDSWVIKMPDGSVSDEHAGHWPSLDAYRAYAEKNE